MVSDSSRRDQRVIIEEVSDDHIQTPRLNNSYKSQNEKLHSKTPAVDYENDIPPWLRPESPPKPKKITDSSLQESLQQQIDEKKKEKQLLLEIKRLEDEKENKRLEKERQQLKLEFERDREAARQKELMEAEALEKQKLENKAMREKAASNMSELETKPGTLVEQARLKNLNAQAVAVSSQPVLKSASPPIPTLIRKNIGPTELKEVVSSKLNSLAEIVKVDTSLTTVKPATINQTMKSLSEIQKVGTFKSGFIKGGPQNKMGRRRQF